MPKTKKSKISKSKTKITKTQVKKSKSLNKNIIIAIVLSLLALGYYGYRSMMVTPGINKIDVGGNSNGDKTKPAKTKYRMEYVGPVDRARTAPVKK